MAWIYKQAGSNKWWVGWRANGKQFLKSTGETEKQKAQEKLREYEFLERAKRDGKLTQQFIESLTNQPLPMRTLKHSIEEWITETEGAAAESTAQKYQAVSKQFSMFVKATESGPMIADITTDDVRAFLTQKRKSTSAATSNQNRKILSIFFIRALKNGIIKANPVLPIKQFKESAGERIGRQPFTLPELKLIYSKAPSLFWRYMILGGFYTGLRMGDLIRLPRAHVDLEANLIRTTPSKTRDRVVHIPIAAPLRKLLEEIIVLRSNDKTSDPLWPEQAANYEKFRANVFSNQFYNEVLAPAGLVPARSHHRKQKNGRDSKREVGNPSFHCLRHTFVSLLKATGGNQAVAKELAGHSSDMVSDLYTHLPLETLSAAIAKLPEFGQ